MNAAEQILQPGIPGLFEARQSRSIKNRDYFLKVDVEAINNLPFGDIKRQFGRQILYTFSRQRCVSAGAAVLRSLRYWSRTLRRFYKRQIARASTWRCAWCAGWSHGPDLCQPFSWSFAGEPHAHHGGWRSLGPKPIPCATDPSHPAQGTKWRLSTVRYR